MSLITSRTSFDEVEMNDCFSKLLEQIDHLKAGNASPPGNWRESYNPLEQAAYHLCQSRHLMETVSRRMADRTRTDSRIIKFGI